LQVTHHKLVLVHSLPAHSSVEDVDGGQLERGHLQQAAAPVCAGAASCKRAAVELDLPTSPALMVVLENLVLL
jgi:hypothetical protein